MRIWLLEKTDSDALFQTKSDNIQTIVGFYLYVAKSRSYHEGRLKLANLYHIGYVAFIEFKNCLNKCKKFINICWKSMQLLTSAE